MKQIPFVALIIFVTASMTTSMLAQAAAPKNVTPEETQKVLHEKKAVVVLDVRTPEEFAKGHIAGAKNIDAMADDFSQRLAALDKAPPYVVHCAAGTRSSKAVKLMQQGNFAEIYHLNGGMKAWEAAGQPVTK